MILITAYSVNAFRLTQFLQVVKALSESAKKLRFWVTKKNAKEGRLNLYVNIQHVEAESNRFLIFVLRDVSGRTRNST